jgi:peptide-methionine (S)-S-oxide reductase
MRKSLFVLGAVVCLTALPTFASAQRTAKAIFAGGCFWTTEYQLENIPGVISAVSGYSGGDVSNPKYEDVYKGRTGHLEAVQVTYDPSKITYRQLVDRFWRTIDPTDDFGQACDIGPSYRTAIFYANDAERAAVEASKAVVDSGPRKGRIQTKIRPAKTFWPAEAEHQDYAKRNPAHYEQYRQGCGRDRILARLWADKPTS